ncbi:MAG: chemotaxis protein CheW [Nitrospirae bacterium]|nr:chemotaxis protein CheW [Nitrospirota bacterium]NTW65836.1 chemotaxis protein CheW [Nitrospirota bacterium]
MNASTVPALTQYLTFLLGDEVFSLEISKVREVLDYTIVTRVPRMPAYLQGVINLRGSVVPVIDLRLKFGMPAADVTVSTCIIIVEAIVNDEQVILGLLADSVQEVLELDQESIKPAPRIGTKLDTRFIKGMGRQNDRFNIILDLDRVFSSDEIDLVQELREAAEVSPRQSA